jgi:hypothetical protein
MTLNRGKDQSAMHGLVLKNLNSGKGMPLQQIDF